MSSPSPMSVSPHAPSGPRADLHGRLGFNGQFHEPGECWQFLGNGYRIYNPVLMRFHSPDSISPFGRGGINAYAYCALDPVNRADPNGQWSFHAFTASLAPFKLRTPLVTPVLVATAASLAAVGLAVASPNHTQRGFAIAGAVIAAAGAFMGGRYAWRQAAKRRSAGSPLKRSRSTLSTLRTNSTTTTPLSATSPVSPAPSMSSFTTPVPRAPAVPSSLRPRALQIAGPRTGVVVRRPGMAPPPPPLGGQGMASGQRVKMHVGDIRRVSVDWHEPQLFTDL